MADQSRYNFPALQTTFPAPYVAHVEINRPKNYNSFSPDVFSSLAGVFDRLSEDENVRCILLSGVGKHFSAGLDNWIMDLPYLRDVWTPLTVTVRESLRICTEGTFAQHLTLSGTMKVKSASTSGPVSQHKEGEDIARRTWKVRRHMYGYQNGINAVERCEKPVIVCCHGVAYGAAIDLALAADIRYCSKDVRFSIKEVDVGLAADVGTLTRLPKVGVSHSWAKEIVYTARDFTGEEAERAGFVSRVFETKDDLVKTGFELANYIATKSPVAVQSSKALFDFSRDRTIQDGLLYTAAWNSPMVQSDDVKKSMTSGIRKTKSVFEKL